MALAHEHDDRAPHSSIGFGFRNGYLDGFQHGSEDRGAQVGHDFASRNYRGAMRGYDPHMGNAELYRNGYRHGYAAGYNDGYYGRPSRFAADFSGPRYRDEAYEHDDGPAHGPSSVAFQVGYKDGSIEGGKDRWKNKEFRPEKNDRYEDADHGYTPDYGPRGDYKREYRQGFVAGYQHGYGNITWGWNR